MLQDFGYLLFEFEFDLIQELDELGGVVRENISPLMLTVEEFFEAPKSIFVRFHLENKESREKIDSLTVADLFVKIRIGFKDIVKPVLSR